MNWCYLHDQFVGDGCNGCVKDRALGIRRAPRKLPNGQWSDGVNRTSRIYSTASALGNPDRVMVLRPDYVDEKFWSSSKSRGEVWAVMVGLHAKSWHAEHSDAITAADKLARSRR